MSKAKKIEFCIGYQAGFMKTSSHGDFFQAYSGKLVSRPTDCVSMQKAMDDETDLEIRETLYAGQKTDEIGIRQISIQAEIVEITAQKAKEILDASDVLNKVRSLPTAQQESVRQYIENLPRLDSIFNPAAKTQDEGLLQESYCLVESQNNDFLFETKEKIGKDGEEKKPVSFTHPDSFFGDSKYLNTTRLEDVLKKIARQAPDTNGYIAKTVTLVTQSFIPKDQYRTHLQEDQNKRGDIHLEAALANLGSNALEILKKYNPNLPEPALKT